MNPRSWLDSSTCMATAGCDKASLLSQCCIKRRKPSD